MGIKRKFIRYVASLADTHLMHGKPFNESVNLPNGILRRVGDVSNETVWAERLGNMISGHGGILDRNGFTLFLRTYFLPIWCVISGHSYKS